MNRPLYLAILWHMHQPYYLNLEDGQMILPWVRFHGCKDYLDMVEILAEFPKIQLNFNFAPSLMDQLELYKARPLDADQYLALSRKPANQLTVQDQNFLLEHFFKANLEQMIKPHWRYFELYQKRQIACQYAQSVRVISLWNEQDFRDLQVWFNLVWIDPQWRHKSSFLNRLMEKAEQFTEEDKQKLLDFQISLLEKILPCYRSFQQQGQIEITLSPYYHPILPLLCDLESAKEATPDIIMPRETFQHPADAQWHIHQALMRYREVFGCDPRGLWPSEGAVSEAILPLVAQEGLKWIASDEAILFRSLAKTRTAHLLYRAYQMNRQEGNLAIVFRDHNLSDLIGFTYSNWPADRAASNLVGHLENIQQYLAKKGALQPYLVTIILDGENAWEHYPNDGRDFLVQLYRRLSQLDTIQTITISDYLRRFSPGKSLPRLASGSWIDGNLNVWIGDKEKNLAWDYLSWARRDLEHQELVPSTIGLAWKALYIAQGSDWNWWYGADHASPDKGIFDQLYRYYLSRVYHFSGQQIPDWLSMPIANTQQAITTTPYSTMHKTS